MFVYKKESQGYFYTIGRRYSARLFFSFFIILSLFCFVPIYTIFFFLGLFVFSFLASIIKDFSCDKNGFFSFSTGYFIIKISGKTYIFPNLSNKDLELFVNYILSFKKERNICNIENIQEATKGFRFYPDYLSDVKSFHFFDFDKNIYRYTHQNKRNSLADIFILIKNISSFSKTDNDISEKYFQKMNKEDVTIKEKINMIHKKYICFIISLIRILFSNKSFYSKYYKTIFIENNKIKTVGYDTSKKNEMLLFFDKVNKEVDLSQNPKFFTHYQKYVLNETFINNLFSFKIDYKTLYLLESAQTFYSWKDRREIKKQTSSEIGIKAIKKQAVL